MSTSAQYVTPDNKIYCEIVKMCRFSSENWFFCNMVLHLQLDLTAAQYF